MGAGHAPRFLAYLKSKNRKCIFSLRTLRNFFHIWVNRLDYFVNLLKEYLVVAIRFHSVSHILCFTSTPGPMISFWMCLFLDWLKIRLKWQNNYLNIPFYKFLYRCVWQFRLFVVIYDWYNKLPYWTNALLSLFTWLEYQLIMTQGSYWSIYLITLSSTAMRKFTVLKHHPYIFHTTNVHHCITEILMESHFMTTNHRGYEKYTYIYFIDKELVFAITKIT